MNAKLKKNIKYKKRIIYKNIVINEIDRTFCWIMLLIFFIFTFKEKKNSLLFVSIIVFKFAEIISVTAGAMKLTFDFFKWNICISCTVVEFKIHKKQDKILEIRLQKRNSIANKKILCKVLMIQVLFTDQVKNFLHYVSKEWGLTKRV